MALIDSLTSCIGMTASQMLTERKRQGYDFYDSRPYKGIVWCSFERNFPELKHKLTLCNWTENNIVRRCEIIYTDDDGCPLINELEQALIDNGIKRETRSFPCNGLFGEAWGYFLPNGEHINLYSRDIVAKLSCQ